MKTGIVYKITNPKNKIYIGSTIQPLYKRIYSYRNLKCKSQIKIYNSIVKYGWENHIVEVLWKGEPQLTRIKEVEFGILYNVLDRYFGLNLSLPKAESYNNCVSLETKKKMSNTRKGRRLSLTHRKAIGLSHRGLKRTKDACENISRGKKGKSTITDFQRKRLKEVHLGKIVSEETKNKLRNSRKRATKIRCKEDNIVFNSIKEASQHYNILYTSIINNAKGKTKKLKINKSFEYV